MKTAGEGLLDPIILDGNLLDGLSKATTNNLSEYVDGLSEHQVTRLYQIISKNIAHLETTQDIKLFEGPEQKRGALVLIGGQGGNLDQIVEILTQQVKHDEQRLELTQKTDMVSKAKVALMPDIVKSVAKPSTKKAEDKQAELNSIPQPSVSDPNSLSSTIVEKPSTIASMSGLVKGAADKLRKSVPKVDLSGSLESIKQTGSTAVSSVSTVAAGVKDFVVQKTTTVPPSPVNSSYMKGAPSVLDWLDQPKQPQNINNSMSMGQQNNSIMEQLGLDKLAAKVVPDQAKQARVAEENRLAVEKAAQAKEQARVAEENRLAVEKAAQAKEQARVAEENRLAAEKVAKELVLKTCKDAVALMFTDKTKTKLIPESIEKLINDFAKNKLIRPEDKREAAEDMKKTAKAAMKKAGEEKYPNTYSLRQKINSMRGISDSQKIDDAFKVILPLEEKKPRFQYITDAKNVVAQSIKKAASYVSKKTSQAK